MVTGYFRLQLLLTSQVSINICLFDLVIWRFFLPSSSFFISLIMCRVKVSSYLCSFNQKACIKWLLLARHRSPLIPQYTNSFLIILHGYRSSCTSNTWNYFLPSLNFYFFVCKISVIYYCPLVLFHIQEFWYVSTSYLSNLASHDCQMYLISDNF